MTVLDQFVVPRPRDYWRRLALREAYYTDRACLVMYYRGQASTLAPYFAGFAESNRGTFCFNGVEWHAVWWRGTEK